MAGDWLKFECNLPEKPEVLAITAAMGWEDPDLTVGKLMRVFRWFDQHTTDGNAAGVTCPLLNRLIGVAGFAESLAACGWLVVSDTGLTLQKFERHNGESAKSRAQTAKRVATHRGNAKANAAVSAPSDDGNAASVTPALAREEKRREEKKGAKAPSVFDAPDWVPAEQWGAFVQMRKAMRNVPFTPAAAKGVVADLQKLCDAGNDPAELLQTAVTNGWRTVYPPKTGAGSLNKQEALEQRNRAAGAAWLAKETFV
jgi:hypothetical protein